MSSLRDKEVFVGGWFFTNIRSLRDQEKTNRIKPHQLIPDLLQDIKGDSSKWINDKRLVQGQFNWQLGYGAFSYSQSHIDRVVKYIKNQEAHHKRKSFKEEYMKILEKFDIPYDEKYILLDIR